MSELSFDDFAYHARGTAFFLDNPSEAEQFKTIYYGYNEEVNELLTDDAHPMELTAKLWGRPVDTTISEKLNANKVSEAGDILWYITASGILRNIPLRDIAGEAVERFTGASAAMYGETIGAFDDVMSNRMAAEVPDEYHPDYRTWRLWDFAPFVDSLDIVLREPTYAKGPLQLIGDGRYALERLHSTLGRFMSAETSSNDEFIASAGLALGGLAIVLKNRFDSSLLAAAHNNMAKRERRFDTKSLQSGQDIERSRPQAVSRPKLSQEESTRINLIEAPQPNL